MAKTLSVMRLGMVVVFLVGFRDEDVLVRGHVYFHCPAPRSCFYGGYFGTDPDGPWRRSPCDRDPIDPQVALVAGSTVCLTVHEFVNHPGYYRVSIFPDAIGPGDPDPAWIVLDDLVPDQGDSTGYQAFAVTIPSNLTCDHCTVQVRQYAADFDWYYYACSDVKVVANASLVAPGDELECEPAVCAWESGPGLIRAKILQQIVLGSVGLVSVMALIGWCVWARRYVGDSKQTTITPAGTPITQDLWYKAKSSKTKTGMAFRLVVGLSIFALCVTGFALIGLRLCW